MSQKWAKQSERGTRFGIVIAAWLYRLLGHRVALILLSPVIFFFYLNGAEQRRASRVYLERAFQQGILKKKPDFWTGFSHFLAFAGSMLDKLASWTGRITNTDVSGVDGGVFEAAKQSGRGGLVLTGHFGNPELIRAVATVKRRFAVTVLMHTANAEKFNSVINQFSEHSTVRVVQVRDIDISIAMQLSERVQNGEWIVLAADRVPPDDVEGKTTVSVKFMGDEARFPTGPYILASALKCPTYFLSCVRVKKQEKPFAIQFRQFADPVSLPRKNRQEALTALAQSYADMLEDVVREAPLQWFNFYDFWNDFETAPVCQSQAVNESKT